MRRMVMALYSWRTYFWLRILGRPLSFSKRHSSLLISSFVHTATCLIGSHTGLSVVKINSFGRADIS